MSIPFTQFLRPDGRTRNITIDLSPETERKAVAIMRFARFEIEVLTTGEIAMETIRLGGESDAVNVLSGKVCANGPDVPAKVAEMIDEVYAGHVAGRESS